MRYQKFVYREDVAVPAFCKRVFSESSAKRTALCVSVELYRSAREQAQTKPIQRKPKPGDKTTASNIDYGLRIY
jgi:hypothetical protein